MQFYQTVEDTTEGPYKLHTTLALAQKHLKAALPAVFRGAARVYLLDVPAHKDALAHFLNDPCVLQHPSYRIAEWRMTARGGLRKELAV